MVDVDVLFLCVFFQKVSISEEDLKKEMLEQLGECIEFIVEDDEINFANIPQKLGKSKALSKLEDKVSPKKFKSCMNVIGVHNLAETLEAKRI